MVAQPKQPVLTRVVAVRKLTKRQNQVYVLLYRKGLAVIDVSRALGISHQAVRSIEKQLIKKLPALNRVPLESKGGRSSSIKEPYLNQQPKQPHTIRLHAVSYRFATFGRARRGAPVMVRVRGHAVIRYARCCVIHFAGEWRGRDPAECERLFSQEFAATLRDVQRETENILVVDGHARYHRFRAHFAEVGNELARDAVRRRRRIVVRGQRDLKGWLHADDSQHLAELETTHAPNRKEARNSRQDMEEVVQPFFNDLREIARIGQDVRLSPVMVRQDEMIEAVAELTKVVRVLVERAAPAPDLPQELALDPGVPWYIG